MAGSMSEADLVADLKASLNDAATVFTAASDADFKRHLAVAGIAFARRRPRTMVGSLTLVADQAAYAVPSGFVGYKSSLWGIAPKVRAKPWESTWPGPMPTVRYVEVDDAKKLYFDPPPSAAQINALGSEFRYYYYAAHVISATADSTTILPGERPLLLLRGQAEAMRELAFRGSKKPVSLRDGYSGAPKNGTPSYLFEALMREFEAAA